MIVQKQTDLQRVTVWCLFWAEDLIGTFFCENAAGQALIGYSALYYDLMIRFL